MKQLNKKERTEPVPESYLLCRECDGMWVDARDGRCAHCSGQTTSKDFHLCLSCALRERRCQNCSQEIEVHIATC